MVGQWTGYGADSFFPSIQKENMAPLKISPPQKREVGQGVRQQGCREHVPGGQQPAESSCLGAPT